MVLNALYRYLRPAYLKGTSNFRTISSILLLQTEKVCQIVSVYCITLNTAYCNHVIEPVSVMQSGFMASEIVKQYNISILNRN